MLFDFQSADSLIRWRVFELLAMMSKAGQTDAGLIQLGLQDAYQSTRNEAMNALNVSGLIDATLTPTVINLLNDSSALVQSKALEYLARAGVVFEPTVRARLVDITRNTRSPYVKRSALEAIGELTDLSDVEISILAEAANDADKDIQQIAAASLISARVPAERAIPSLLPLLSSDDVLTAITVRDRFQRALQNQQFPLVLVADTAHATADPDARASILSMIETFETVDEAIVPALTKLLADPQPSTSKAAARLIGRSGTTDARNLAALERAMHWDGVRGVALLAYEHLVPRSNAAAEAAAGLLDNSDVQLRLAAAIVLSVHGNAAAQATVRESLSSDNSELQGVALEALRNLPAAADLFHPEIEPLLQSPDLITRRYGVELLVEGQSSDQAIEALRGLLEQAQPVAGILHKAGKKAASAIPELQKALELGMESAIPVLCDLAPPELIMESLEQALSHRQANIRATAAAAIGKMGHAPENVVTRLETLSHDFDQDVRIAARGSLARLVVTTH